MLRRMTTDNSNCCSATAACQFACGDLLSWTLLPKLTAVTFAKRSDLHHLFSKETLAPSLEMTFHFIGGRRCHFRLIRFLEEM